MSGDIWRVTHIMQAPCDDIIAHLTKRQNIMNSSATTLLESAEREGVISLSCHHDIKYVM